MSDEMNELIREVPHVVALPGHLTAEQAQRAARSRGVPDTVAPRLSFTRNEWRFEWSTLVKAELAPWLRQQLDEDERIVADWPDDLDSYGHPIFRPGSTVLRQVENRRKIIAIYEDARHRAEHGPTHDARITAREQRGVLESVLRLLANDYSDRPGYREEWRL